MCCGVAAITANTRATNSAGTRAWNRSDIELTNTTRGSRHRNGAASVASWVVTPNPGPDVRGSPSFWYFADPMLLSRFANVRA